MYYSSQKHFEDLYKKTFRTHTFQAETQDEYEVWSHSLREKLHELIGTRYMQESPLYPEILETVECDGYVRKKMLIHTEKDVVMSFYVLIPNSLKEEKRTAVIACHGHASNGKEAVAGIRNHRSVADTINKHDYNYGEVLAQKGYVVFAPDARGFGERRERFQQGDDDALLMSSSCQILNHMAIPLGQCVLGMWVWDLMRLIDYALSCEFINNHIACVGLSGGGYQSLWLSALDTRVECSVISGYFYGSLQALLIDSHNCSCNYVPNLWRVADMGDIGALICPRPLLIETGDQDQYNGADGVANVYTQVETVRRAMKVFGTEKNLCHDVYHGVHKWYGVRAYEWLMKYVPPNMS